MMQRPRRIFILLYLFSHQMFSPLLAKPVSFYSARFPVPGVLPVECLGSLVHIAPLVPLYSPLPILTNQSILSRKVIQANHN